MTHLFKCEAEGYKEVQGPPVDSRGGPHRPWALTPDGRVVFSEWRPQRDGLTGIFELALGKMHGKAPLRAYDRGVSQLRRREFETLLASDAAKHPECAMPAVNLVSDGLRAYLADRKSAKGVVETESKADDCVKDRCFSDINSGRLGTKADSALLAKGEALKLALAALNGTDIPKILSIQAAFANALSRHLQFSADQARIHQHAAQQVAPSQGFLYSWFDTKLGTEKDNLLRGRERGDKPEPSSAPGLMQSGGGEEPRERGIDLWHRDERSPFVKALDLRNLNFGAGRSGTTGELLKTYRAFGGTDSGESFKQYLLAIVVYIVGGGHHTCHEIFSVANLMVGSNGPRGSRSYASVSTLVNDAYVPGKYLKHLPNSYTTTTHFKTLAEKYYDIAYMGHLHGTFV